MNINKKFQLVRYSVLIIFIISIITLSFILNNGWFLLGFLILGIVFGIIMDLAMKYLVFKNN